MKDNLKIAAFVGAMTIGVMLLHAWIYGSGR